MKRIILIDGENLLYGLRKIMGNGEDLMPRENFLNYPFKSLLQEVLGDTAQAHILYYGARLRKYEQTEELKEKTEKAIRMQARLVNNLQRQGINFVKVGYLRARETEACPNCEYQEWHLLEKGVDVGLAVRVVSEASPEVEIVLASSDTDLLPALKNARSQGSKVIFVGYEYQPVLALAREASLTRLITRPMVEKYYNAT